MLIVHVDVSIATVMELGLSIDIFDAVGLTGVMVGVGVRQIGLFGLITALSLYVCYYLILLN
jgi:hypothetical protein